MLPLNAESASPFTLLHAQEFAVMVKDAMLIDSLLTVKTIGYHHTVGTG
jgi:hypothetical protein